MGWIDDIVLPEFAEDGYLSEDEEENQAYLVVVIPRGHVEDDTLFFEAVKDVEKEFADTEVAADWTMGQFDHNCEWTKGRNPDDEDVHYHVPLHFKDKDGSMAKKRKEKWDAILASMAKKRRTK